MRNTLSSAGGSGSEALPPLRVPKPKQTQAWALLEAEFSEGLVGGKSRMLPTLRAKLPQHLAVPASLALPFGVAERVIAAPENKGVAQELSQLHKCLVSSVSGPVMLPAGFCMLWSCTVQDVSNVL